MVSIRNRREARNFVATLVATLSDLSAEDRILFLRYETGQLHQGQRALLVEALQRAGTIDADEVSCIYNRG